VSSGPNGKRRNELEDGAAIGAGTKWRFSMATLLLAMVLCGVAAAVASHAPRLNRQAWQSVAFIGACGGTATLLSYWAATRRGWVTILAASAAALAIGCLLGSALHLVDWFVPSMSESMYGWPPNDDPSLASVFSGGESPLIWPRVVLVVMVMTLLALTGVMILLGNRRSSTRKHAIRVGAASIMALVIVASAAAPAVLVLYRMLTPEPVPVVAIPEPNAWDVFVGAGASISNTTFYWGNFDQSAATPGQLKKALNEGANALRQARRGFSMECVSPVNYSFGAEVLMEPLDGLRTLANAFSGESRLAHLDGDYERALNSGLDEIQLGCHSRNGGLLIEAFIGMSITSAGKSSVYKVHDKLSAEQCRNAVRRIEAAASAREPTETILHRDYIWELYATGWHGRLYAILSRLCEEQFAAENAFAMEEAYLALLKAHLQLRAFGLEHSVPATWEESELPPLPIDPWDPESKPLRYLRNGDGFVLYSVGPNGVDDRGAMPKADEVPALSKTGDFRLDFVYVPEVTFSAPAVIPSSAADGVVHEEAGAAAGDD
jgi:hypothetical protein